ncbi:RagB/SusD family nutrient uptake outer membrane protein [Carboxylicivirga sp. M1479]|uniref:RagB/SusD family nutrient uptake outer membrane protein n=1 Tax=Carboxylicivirga sp. M1479 TaxID=2594476 RepID=UPI001178AE4B|nr:RagB/SusD family nutrient uptake outer membrane protein [Carboxylicivirga sp. M1479]TRX66427.1 RagB/SusD family nutrient uptake outer membrane protein [Carboxylicivirga sp. M1479]
MQNIKSSYIALLIVVLAAFNSSCEDALREEPRSFYSSNTFFESIEQANMAVIGVYDLLGTTNLYGQVVSTIFPCDTDISQIRGTGDDGSKRTVGHYTFHPSIAMFERAWRDYYFVIERANYAIDGISKMKMLTNGTEEEKRALEQHIGEAKFLRALVYFDLVRMWGDVPFKTAPTSANEDLNQTRTNRLVIYDQIISDLEYAKAKLPWASEKALDERVSQGAARGYLVRVLMGRAGYSLQLDGNITRPDDYLDYFKRAALEADTIIKSNEHLLNIDYEQVFRNYAQGTIEPMESMFEIAFSPMGINAENGGFISTYIGPKTSAESSYGRANAFINAMWAFYDSYSLDDARRQVAIADYEVKADDTRKYYTKSSDKKKIFPGKWRREWNASAPEYTNDTDVNWVLLRYSDVLLMYAEAINECRNDLPGELAMSDAFEAIRLVRQRVDLDPWDSSTTQNDFRDNIIKERAWELCYEGWRKWDLIRWNIMDEKIQEAAAAAIDVHSKYPYPAAENFVDGKHQLYPIPQREMDVNTGLGQQNPGYGS